MLWVIHGYKGTLTGALQSHEGEGTEENAGTFYSKCNQLLVVGEDTDDWLREKHDEGP